MKRCRVKRNLGSSERKAQMTTALRNRQLKRFDFAIEKLRLAHQKIDCAIDA